MADDVPKMDQGLLQKNPALTDQEFSDYWYYQHSQVVIPFFLHSGIKHYEQIHGPLTPQDPSSSVIPSGSTTALDLANFHGVCALPPQPALKMMSQMKPAWKLAYFNEVIKVDERRFLVADSLSHVVRIPPKSTQGLKRVVIKEGKFADDVVISEDVWRVWREYEVRGEAEAKGETEDK